MQNIKFKKAAQSRKVMAFFLSILTFLVIIGFVLYQTSTSPSDFLDAFLAIFYSPEVEKPSVNYP